MNHGMKWLAALGILAAAGGARAETLGVVSPQKGSWENSAAEFGDRLGYFKAVGIDLNLLFINGGGEAQQAVISGSADIGLGNGVLASLGTIGKGAPVTVISSSFIGAADTYWYVKADSPIKSLKDTTGHTIGFSTPGSSSNASLLSVLEALGVQGARPVPTGAPAATMTQLMSGQVDVGYAITPFALDQVGDGTLRLVGRGTDSPALSQQSVRVIFVNSATLASKHDAVVRFMQALRRTLDWMYSDDPRVMEWYAAGAGVSEKFARQSRADFDPRSAVELGPVLGLDTSMRQAVEFKYLKAPLTEAQIAQHFQIIDGK